MSSQSLHEMQPSSIQTFLMGVSVTVRFGADILGRRAPTGKSHHLAYFENASIAACKWALGTCTVTFRSVGRICAGVTRSLVENQYASAPARTSTVRTNRVGVRMRRAGERWLPLVFDPWLKGASG